MQNGKSGSYFWARAGPAADIATIAKIPKARRRIESSLQLTVPHLRTPTNRRCRSRSIHVRAGLLRRLARDHPRADRAVTPADVCPLVSSHSIGGLLRPP